MKFVFFFLSNLATFAVQERRKRVADIGWNPTFQYLSTFTHLDRLGTKERKTIYLRIFFRTRVRIFRRRRLRFRSRAPENIFALSVRVIAATALQTRHSPLGTEKKTRSKFRSELLSRTALSSRRRQATACMEACSSQ